MQARVVMLLLLPLGEMVVVVEVINIHDQIKVFFCIHKFLILYVFL